MANYKTDSFCRDIFCAVSELLTTDRVVSPVEVFVRRKLLSKEDQVTKLARS